MLPMFWGGCANSSRGPSGGPKDTIPPVMLNMFPIDNAVGFTGKQISFTFNEYVQLKDQQKQFTISPPTEKRPVLKIKGKGIIVEFPSGLKENTTYSVTFGQSVSDLNEGNPVDHLSITFSTGNTIDSMMYIGRLVDALTLDPVEGAFAFLYEENTDSIPYLQRPIALGRSDKDGVFIIKGLKPVQYKIVAVNDANNNYLYDAGNENIGFDDKLINTYHLTSSDSLSYNDLPVLKMFTENVRKQFLLSHKQPEKRQLELIFNQQNPEIISFNVDGLNKDDFILEHSRWNDTLRYWIKAKTIPDTLNAVINYMRTDSINQLSPTETNLRFVIETKKEEDKTLTNRQNTDNISEKSGEDKVPKFRPTIKSGPQHVFEKNVQIIFNAPLMQIDKSLIKLYTYNIENEKELIESDIIQDTLLIREYHLLAKWKTATKYELELLPGAFTDIYELSNDSIIHKFDITDPEKHCSITVGLLNTKGSYIIQLMKGSTLIDEKFADSDGNYSFTNLNTGKYKIRLIEDRNANRIWDIGSYLQHIQAERVEYIKFGEGSNELELRPNRFITQSADISLIFNDNEK